MSEKAVRKVLEHAREGLRVREAFFEENAQGLVEIARNVALALTEGGKVLFCGNGGSAADSQHLAAEFVNRFKLERPPLPAIALTTDTSIITAIGNDYGFDLVFVKQVQALGLAGDILVGISTSGTSRNVLAALREAKSRGLVTIGMCGAMTGEMEPLCDHLISVGSKDTALIQEVHIAAGHMLCHVVDHYLFEAVMELGQG
ncbi:MAG: D-sedoheptulose 7-phosphate isomerase [Humidesulfovibrio sp.]|nr:D-sedoheptulose 7-phosphate isomerase [Humidesulfovibrio sp.]